MITWAQNSVGRLVSKGYIPVMASNDKDLGDDSAPSSQDQIFRRIGMYIYWFSQLEYMLRIVATRHLGLTDGQAGWLMPVIDFASLCNLCKAHIEMGPVEIRPKSLELI